MVLLGLGGLDLGRLLEAPCLWFAMVTWFLGFLWGRLDTGFGYFILWWVSGVADLC